MDCNEIPGNLECNENPSVYLLCSKSQTHIQKAFACPDVGTHVSYLIFIGPLQLQLHLIQRLIF